MKSPVLRWSAVGLLILIAVIHLYMAPSEYEETPALGYLFIANFVLALVAAVGIRRQAAWGWVLGFWAAGGAIAGYIVTRTVAMPGMEPEEWLYPVGVVATLLEVSFLVLFAAARPWAGLAGFGSRPALLVNGAALGFVVGFGLAGALWGLLGATAHDMPDLAHATSVSSEQFAEEYGVKVDQVAPSMLNSVVDFRLRILDKTKAEKFLSGHDSLPVLVVGDVILMPPSQHMHQRRLKDGTSFYVFYPNPNQVVTSGTQVSVLFGDLRLPATTAQ
jgi:hypothetical protein